MRVRISKSEEVPVRKSTYPLLEVTSIRTTPRRAVDQVGWIAWVGDATFEVVDCRSRNDCDANSESDESGFELHSEYESYWA